MKIRYELLNFVTGVLLLVAGIIQLPKENFSIALGWIIFGSMYLVMDDYIPKPEHRSGLDWLTDLARKIFSWVGLIGSFFLLILYLTWSLY